VLHSFLLLLLLLVVVVVVAAQLPLHLRLLLLLHRCHLSWSSLPPARAALLLLPLQL
jgi:hypothetical protein